MYEPTFYMYVFKKIALLIILKEISSAGLFIYHLLMMTYNYTYYIYILTTYYICLILCLIHTEEDLEPNVSIIFFIDFIYNYIH